MAANSWLNALVAFEIHRLLDFSDRRLRYFPPSDRALICKALGVYLFAAFLASWSVVAFPWLPHKTNSVDGMVCIPVEFDRASTLFFWLAFYPVLVAIPLICVVWVTWNIKRRDLLPPTGKKREISIFFFRIVVVFVAIWIPASLALYVVGCLDPWYLFAAGIWTHIQGSVSATVSMFKADIRLAVQDFFCCRTFRANREFDRMPQGYMSNRSFRSSRQLGCVSGGRIVSDPPNGNNTEKDSTQSSGTDVSRHHSQELVSREPEVAVDDCDGSHQENNQDISASLECGCEGDEQISPVFTGAYDPEDPIPHVFCISLREEVLPKDAAQDRRESHSPR